MTSETLGVLDTSVVIDRAEIEPSALPDTWALSAVTLAELSAGPLLTDDPAARELNVSWILNGRKSNVEAIPFTSDTSRIYGWLRGLVHAAGRKPRPKLSTS